MGASPRFPRRGRSRQALLVAWVCVSCASPITAKVVKRDSPRKVAALAVYPFEFRWSEPAYRSFQLGWGEAIDLMASQRWALYGPGEFHIREPTDDNVYAATDLAAVLGQQGFRPDEVLVIRGWAERQEQRSSRQIYDSNGKPMGQRLDAQITLVGHAEVVDPIAREPIAEVTGNAEVDPFAPTDDADPDPVLTALEHQVMSRMAEVLSDIAPGAEVSRTQPIRYSWVPGPIYDFEDQGRPSLQSLLAALDPLSREAMRVAPLRWFGPQLPASEVDEMQHLPGGLWVTRVLDRTGPTDVHVGDLITSVAGEAATPLSLARILRRAKPGEPLEVKLRRGSAEGITGHLAVAE